MEDQISKVPGYSKYQYEGESDIILVKEVTMVPKISVCGGSDKYFCQGTQDTSMSGIRQVSMPSYPRYQYVGDQTSKFARVPKISV